MSNDPCPLLSFQIDLANFLVEFPESNIAKLAETGVLYEDFQLPGPTDSFPAIATHVTGSTCAQHGIFYGAMLHPHVVKTNIPTWCQCRASLAQRMRRAYPA